MHQCVPCNDFTLSHQLKGRVQTWSSCWAIPWHSDPVPTQDGQQLVLSACPAARSLARQPRLWRETRPPPAPHRPLSSTALSFLGLINPEPVFDPTKQDCGYLGGWACHGACRQTPARLGRAASLVTRTEVLHRVNPRASPALASDKAPGGQLIIVLRNSQSSLPVLLGGAAVGGRWVNKSLASVCSASETPVYLGILLQRVL